MRQVGPLLRGNRVARANLTAAFPEKSRADIDQILRGVWTHFGRMPVEMASIDLLWDYDLDRDRRGRILVDQTTRERLLRLRQQGGPVLCFGAHLGNWELLAVAMAALGFIPRPSTDRRVLRCSLMSFYAFANLLWGS